MSRILGDLAMGAAFFAALSRDVVKGEKAGLEKAAVIVETEAKRVMGTYDLGWPALKPETIARKATGDSPLLETGAMRESIEHEVHGRSAFIGTDSQIAVYHDKGTSKMPPRPFLLESALRKEHEICEAVGDAIIRKLP